MIRKSLVVLCTVHLGHFAEASKLRGTSAPIPVLNRESKPRLGYIFKAARPEAADRGVNDEGRSALLEEVMGIVVEVVMGPDGRSATHPADRHESQSSKELAYTRALADESIDSILGLMGDLAMTTDRQFAFPFLQGRELVVNTNGGAITSDAGLIPLRQFDEALGYTQRLCDALDDRRDGRFVDLQLGELVSQRVYQLVGGYEHGLDANILRNDPTIKAVAGRLPEDDPLGSQSTISRLENSVTRADCYRVSQTMVDLFMESRPRRPHELVLDIDPTKHETYGAQQLTFFNDFYKDHMYFPMLIYEANSKYLLAAMLRDGKAGGNTNLMQMLPRVVDRLRGQWDGVMLTVRGDSGIGSPELYAYCEEHRMTYYIGLPSNERLKKLSKPVVDKAEGRYKKTGRDQKLYTSFRYQADSWDWQRRVVVKVEVTARGTNVRYIVTNGPGKAKEVYKYYAKRGNCENYIDELKNGFSHKMSCHRFVANQWRLLMHAAAYNLTVLFQPTLEGTELARAEVSTVRTKLFKVGAVVKQTTRRVRFELSSTWPYGHVFAFVADRLVPAAVT